MTLKEYLKKNGIMQNFFADKVGTTPSVIDRLIRLGYVPTLKLALAIEKETKGKVSVHDWDLSKNAKCVSPNKKNT